jgi:hypothetical protein
LLLEYKAEVVEEELLDDEAEVTSIYFPFCTLVLLFFPLTLEIIFVSS